jgi:hypothetical protein
MRPIYLLLMLTLVPVSMSGCSSSDAALEDDLKKMGLAYVEFQTEKDASPAGWDELITFAEEKNLSPDAIRRVRDAGCTATWGLDPDAADGQTVFVDAPGEARSLMADGGLEEE